MAVSDTLIGNVFDGRYRIERKLGTGGMADVYLAEDNELGRRVAIKILNDRHAADDQFVGRFRREAKNGAGLSHPNIVSVYARGTAEGTYYIAMEYLDGRSLKELIVSRGPAPVKTAVEYARQILAAVGFAHRHGIVHRDIKPHNVLVAGDEGRVKVTDFGIARSGASQMTEVGSIIGTAQYLSPEQARGAPVDQTSDLYSVGVVLYEMLTGQVPFTGDTPLEIAMKHLSEVPKPPSELRPEVPHDLDRILAGMPVGDETADAATAVLSGSGVLATAPTSVITRETEVAPRRPAPPGRTPPAGYYGYEGPPRRRRPVWPWILAVLLLAAAGFAAWFAYTKIQDQLNNSKPVSVPSVVGLRESLAVEKIRARDLVPDVSRENSETVAKGYVIRQDEGAGLRMAKGSTVHIHVSKGLPPVEVPDVIGKSRDDAVATLTSAGLKPKVFLIHSAKPADQVIAQDPTGSAPPNSTITLSVSKGPKQAQVPDVTNQDEASARATLQAAGFRVAVQRQDVQDPALEGIVLSQSPGGGTKAAEGSTVTIIVGKLSETPPPPPIP